MRINILGLTLGKTSDTDSPNLKLKNGLTDFGINWLGGGNVFAGKRVDEHTAMGLDTVYACIRDKSESIGQLPVKMQSKDGEDITSGREYEIFCKNPNSFMTMQDFIETYVTCLESYGRFFAYTKRNKYGNVSEIIPFRYQRQIMVNMDTNGNIYYTYTTNDGKPYMGFNNGEILHIKLNSLDGFTGMSPITTAARTLGISIAQEDYLENLMENGAIPRGVLETDNVFVDETKGNRILQQWNELYKGTSNAGKTALLENGLKYKGVTLSPSDTELIKQRIFSRTQICSIFRVPPHRVNAVEMKAGGYDKLEDNNRAYMRDSLVPIIYKLENALNPLIRGGSKIELDTKGFVRGDRESQVRALREELVVGLVSLNEGRIDLGRKPLEGGDVFAIDTNNLTFGKYSDIERIQRENREMMNEPVEQVEDEENVE